jgi:hypothetical protein
LGGVDHGQVTSQPKQWTAPKILNCIDRIDRLDKVARRAFGLKDDNPYSHYTLNKLTLNSLNVEIRDKE